MEEIQPKQLDNREVAFAECYLFHLNKTQAARDIGCPEAGARQQGFELYKRPHVKAYIEAKLNERTISADEVVKMTSDIANANITDYYRTVQRPHTPRIKVGLADVIKQVEETIEYEEECAELMPEDWKGRKAHEKSIDRMRLDIAKMRVKLRRNPDEYIITDGPTEMIDYYELDMALLIADKEKGKVKKIKHHKDGTIEIEMYSAADAHDKLLRIGGKFEKDNSQKNSAVKSVTVNIVPPIED